MKGKNNCTISLYQYYQQGIDMGLGLGNIGCDGHSSKSEPPTNELDPGRLLSSVRLMNNHWLATQVVGILT